MKYYFLIFFTFFFVASCSKDPHPKKIYEAYLIDVQKVEHLSEFSFSSYLSKRAQDYVAKKMKRAGIIITSFSITINGSPIENKLVETESSSITSDEMTSLFLKVWKSDATMPTEYSEEWQMNDKTAEWQFIDEKLLDPDTQLNDSTLKTTVHFVNEIGWKIDKIERTRTSKDGSSMKSTTF